MERPGSEIKGVKVKLLYLILVRGTRVCPLYQIAWSCSGKNFPSLKIDVPYLVQNVKTLIGKIFLREREEREMISSPKSNRGNSLLSPS